MRKHNQPKTMVIKTGDVVLVWVTFDGGYYTKRAVVELEGATRNRTVKLKCDDGEMITFTIFK